ncbi:M48 family metallopeptidase [Marinobacter salarius]|uniref:Peptidase M48 n=1 Tax=Marinobacter salarius TaxID=1420917 RepID=A0A1W6K808_9GAMM|nr:MULTISPECIES: M48 family metallopeptidase [Marinobacter]ARM83576.1 peptidase M48 [Marinobacter salarius]MBJ7299855.1 M48 family metallopeptidase [Marinobacter salarius]HIO31103.1 peptidase M48 [Marinobacter salarius]HIO98800.1 peptidase M48 [Marinobacter salarius]
MAHPGFFQRQASARRNTGLLVALFLAAVVIITLLVCLVGYLVTRSEYTGLAFADWLLSRHGLYTAIAVVALIGIGSLIRWADLSGGGERVAKMVGARAIDPATRDTDERRLRNIVEEMSIASGISVPDLYVMDHETGINAFVAGYTPGEAVMVVTHGALTQLTRDELQGVVGHEFSHVLNGDMRLNVRLIAILAGILMIGQIGAFLLRASFYRSHVSSHSSRDRRGQAVFGLVGLALLVIGYVGVFFGRLIQSAVSRQREMLADASSVQFTRNPEGIAGALFKIGLKGGYLDTTSHASDMNHMCFGESARMKFAALLASHPPVQERIEAIQPGMFARLRSRLRDSEPGSALRSMGSLQTSETSADTAHGAVSGFSATSPRASTSPLNTRPSADISTTVGTVNKRSEDYAVDLLNRLPSTFRNLLYTRAGAIQLCYALLIYQLPESSQQKRLALVTANALFAPNADLLNKLLPALTSLGEAVRFPALELAMPALRKLDPDERNQLMSCTEVLIRADNRLSLYELAMHTFLRRHLAGDSARPVPVRHRSYRTVTDQLQVLFSLMARAGARQGIDSQGLFTEAMAGFTDGPKEPELLETVSIKHLRDALLVLNTLSPLLKPAILDACGHCVLADGEIKTTEYELIRLVADQLDCPMPPLAA